MEVDPIRVKEDIKKFKKKAVNKRNKILIEIGLNSGLRISDILKIKVKNVTNNEYINLLEEKTNKNRKISLNPKVKSKIEEYIEQENLKSEDYLFQSRKGENKPISRVQAYRILNQVADRAGLDIKVGTHTLRKTFGYHHYRKYKDVAQLQAIFNHSSPDITLDYIGVTQEEIDRTVKEMYL